MAYTSELNHYEQGVACLEKHDLAGARAAFEQAIAAGQSTAQAHNNLATVLLRLDELNLAEQHLLRAIAAEPSFYHPYMNLGSLCMARQDMARAEEYYLKALQVASEVPEIYYNLGIIYVWRKELPKAKTMFEKVIQLRAFEPRFHLMLAILYLQLGELYPAQANALLALNQQHDMLDALRVLGETFLRQGKPLQALDALRACLEADPENVDLMLRVGLLLVDLRYLDEAISLMEAAAARVPDRQEVREILGLLYYDRGDGEKARAYFQELLLSEPDNELAAEILSQIGSAPAAPPGLKP